MDYTKLTFTGSRRGTTQDPLTICLREVKNGYKANGKGRKSNALRVYIPLAVVKDCGWNLETRMAWAMTPSENALIVRQVKNQEQGLKFHSSGNLSGKAYLEITGIGRFAMDDCDHHYAEEEYLVIYFDKDPG